MDDLFPHIPVTDVGAEISPLRAELVGILEDVLSSSRFVLGTNVAAFEAEMGSYLSSAYAVGLNSGTDALTIALRALGVGPGHEVITTAFTFFATAEAISHVGAAPVFVDIAPDNYNLDPDLVAERVTDRTAAILPVHLFGFPAPMDDILAIAEDHGLDVVEDCAQACGGEWKDRKLGTLGRAGAFSFYPSKNLAACGDAGLLTTDDEGIARSARMLRQHGSAEQYRPEVVGYNSRLDEFQAAILRRKLADLDRRNEERRRIALYYDEQLAGVGGLVRPPTSATGKAVYHQYTVRVTGGDRDQLRRRLAEMGVATRVYYPHPLHRLPMYSGAPALPHAERAAREVLSLPIWPEMAAAQAERVVAALRACLA